MAWPVPIPSPSTPSTLVSPLSQWAPSRAPHPHRAWIDTHTNTPGQQPGSYQGWGAPCTPSPSAPDSRDPAAPAVPVPARPNLPVPPYPALSLYPKDHSPPAPGSCPGTGCTGNVAEPGSSHLPAGSRPGQEKPEIPSVSQPRSVFLQHRLATAQPGGPSRPPPSRLVLEGWGSGLSCASPGCCPSPHTPGWVMGRGASLPDLAQGRLPGHPLLVLPVPSALVHWLTPVPRQVGPPPTRGLWAGCWLPVGWGASHWC